jgi:hypothetical protein
MAIDPSEQELKTRIFSSYFVSISRRSKVNFFCIIPLIACLSYCVYPLHPARALDPVYFGLLDPLTLLVHLQAHVRACTKVQASSIVLDVLRGFYYLFADFLVLDIEMKHLLLRKKHLKAFDHLTTGQRFAAEKRQTTEFVERLSC